MEFKKNDVSYMLSIFHRVIRGETEIIVKNTIDNTLKNYGVLAENECAIIDGGGCYDDQKYFKFRFFTKNGETLIFIAFENCDNQLLFTVIKGHGGEYPFDDLSKYEKGINVICKHLKATVDQIECVLTDIFKNDVLFDINIVSDIIVPFIITKYKLFNYF